MSESVRYCPGIFLDLLKLVLRLSRVSAGGISANICLHSCGILLVNRQNVNNLTM